MRRPTDKRSKRQARIEHSERETGYTIPTGTGAGTGYTSGYDTTETGGYQKAKRGAKYDSGKPGRNGDDGIPL